jgi:hypothetical protein
MTLSRARPIQSTAPHPISPTSIYHPPTHVLVFLEVSFPLAFPPITYTSFFSLPLGPHASPISSSSKTKLRGLSPWEYYTDRATAACQRSQCQLLRIESSVLYLIIVIGWFSDRGLNAGLPKLAQCITYLLVFISEWCWTQKGKSVYRLNLIFLFIGPSPSVYWSGPLSLLSSGYGPLSSTEQSRRAVQLSIHLHLVPKTWNTGAEPPFLHTEFLHNT